MSRSARLLLAMLLITAGCAAPREPEGVARAAHGPRALASETAGGLPARSAANRTVVARATDDARNASSSDPEALPVPATETAPEATGGAAPDDAASTAGVEGSDAEAEGAEGAEEEANEEEAKPSNSGRVVLDTEYDDARVGREQTPAIEAELGLVEDEELTEYVHSVALRLLRHAPRRPFDWEFKIVDQQVPNAFALPGGKIYVSRGLLALVTSEDELAGVLGHEITHAAERHASARLEYAKRQNPFTIGFLRAAKIAAYGRDQERDADRGGQLLAARAGYDPRGIATFLRKLDAAERYEIGWSRLPSFFATHPTSPERSAIANDRANSIPWERGDGVAGETPEAYFEIVDGLVIGDDPAGGVFDEGNRFVHPELRFSLRFPPGWQTMNSEQAVRALSPRRDAQAELTVVGDDSKPLEEVVDAFLESEFEDVKFRIRERRRIRVGDLPAMRVEGRISSPIGRISASMTFVSYEALVYRLTMLTLPGASDRYRGRTRAFPQTFRPLDDEGVRSLRVTRLRIARALESETLAQLCERTRNELELVYTGVLNGLYASTPLPHRMPIKIGIAEPYLPRSRQEGGEVGGVPRGDGDAAADAPPAAEPDEGGTEPRTG